MRLLIKLFAIFVFIFTSCANPEVKAPEQDLEAQALYAEHKCRTDDKKRLAADFGFVEDKLRVTLSDKSQSPYSKIAHWYWDFGNGRASKEQDPKTAYRKIGKYQVRLFIKDEQGYCDSAMKTIEVKDVAYENKPPVVDFTNRGDTITNKSFDPDGRIIAWIWHVRGVQTSEYYRTETPSLIGGPPFKWNVKLTAVDDKGAKSSIEKHISLGGDGMPIPTVEAKFLARPENTTVYFSDHSFTDGKIDKWEWDFGDGETSSERNPTHQYRQGGVYKVSLSVWSGDKKYSTSKNVYLCESVIGGLEINHLSKGNKLELFGIAKIPEDTIESWNWDIAPNIKLSGKNVVYTYSAESQDAILDTILTVRSKSGSICAVNKSIYLNKYLPVAIISYKAAGLKVDFTDLSRANGLPITGWLWSFGDGQTSTEQNPKHTYARAGRYKVKLVVKDESGNRSKECEEEIVIYPSTEPVAEFSKEINEFTVKFSDKSNDPDGKIVKWFWEFEPGATSYKQNPAYTFGKHGSKKVSLTVTDDSGIESKITGWVNIEIPERYKPKPSFENEINGKTVKFTDTSTSEVGQIKWWDWEFGDDEFVSGRNPTHIYKEAGKYKVILTVTNTSDVKKTFEKTLIISDTP